jgi:hypothetical protein
MNELFTLLNSQSDAEMEATYWLAVFEDLPDSYFQKMQDQPSLNIITALKQYARAYRICGNEGIVLN